MPWIDKLNAQLYEEYAQAFPMYRELGRKMVEVAGIGPGMTVVDLACGTGVVTEQIFAKLEDKGKVIGVDRSRAMLEFARNKLPDVEFLEVAVEEVHEVLPEGSVDVAVCNSAFWQMDVEKAVEAIARVLRPGGRFIFNLNEGYRLVSEPTTTHLGAIMDQIAVEEYGYVGPQRQRRRQPISREASLEEVQAFLENTALPLQAHETFEVEHTAESHYVFKKIPVMTEWELAGMDYETRMEILEKAYERFDKSFRGVGIWRFYVTVKK
ncbi:MAG TPA: class I SAM-dependent methyltransferase [Ktedonobacteraceae bacterium]|nr:class I SAM-dependent methyltransferase [Ktedonobacteraceae bacterium]